jgi:hypothetical protein
MSLGTFAGLNLIFCVKKLLESQKSKLNKYSWILILIITMLTLFLSGSRTALISAIAGTLFLLIKYFRHDKGRLFNILLITVLVTILTSTMWLTYTSVLSNKMSSSELGGGLTSSRDQLWGDRINEFTSSPLLGVGFGSIDVNISKATPFSKQTGTLEPGSSWLFLLSSTGLFGFFCFLIIFLLKIIRTYKVNNNDSFNAFLLGVLIFFFIHLFSEGYLLSCGEFTFFMFWLTIGINYRNQGHNLSSKL